MSMELVKWYNNSNKKLIVAQISQRCPFEKVVDRKLCKFHKRAHSKKVCVSVMLKVEKSVGEGERPK